ncbi:DNA mismatch repair endonuclease MutL [Leptolyngbya sp. FACHB-711]|uniref:DNA mismatch repair endonuclease MutL n=1 Tax=unclassified Leptolyngbya TaxID=2650499 RepID=UPI001687E03F|nr:DNA mismatch repair endonuclease MutL [Leptolyngbya sp. FACHB-711]MBD2024845.1 DNA mismatch repair endonuclease MutL [Leptolyngbya sp. FACHB-711]
MTSKIQLLPDDVVHLIAAGEVIDSLAAVVRELAENALDAGATRITISIWAERWRVRVADNGGGMSLADLEQAAQPHSTSKIQTSLDLWQISSLGFRGEALHSLAQLADLEICSRSPEEDAGWRISYSPQGEPLQAEAIALAPGTIVTVSNLFGRWLPRRQGLPSLAQQLRLIQLTIQQLALCHPHVTWHVEQNDRLWFAISGGASTRQILPQFLRDVQLGDLQDLKLHLPEKYGAEDAFLNGSLYLLVGLPDRCHRHRPDWIKVAVNGRTVRVPELEQSVLASFRRTLPRDRFPVCFVHLRLTPEQIDWNRHPAKAEIYLHHLDRWQKQIMQAIERALRLSEATLPDTAYSAALGQIIKAAEVGGSYGNLQPEPAPGSHEPELPLIPLKAIAQIHKMYVLVEHPTGVWLVEQHIAHERILYEQLCNHWQMVTLDPPLVLEGLSPAQLEQLQRIGIETEPFGDRLWAVRTVPEILAARSDCAEAIVELSLGGNLEAALVATACRAALRNGTPLSEPEMQQLIDQWQQTRQPRTCPHGRPIFLPLEESSLSRFFRRHWVVGKSHGI